MTQPFYVPPPPHRSRYARAQELVHEALSKSDGALSTMAIARVTRLNHENVGRALEAIADQGLLVKERAEHVHGKPWVYRLRELRQ
jgi:hypothetical protein